MSSMERPQRSENEPERISTDVEGLQYSVEESPPLLLTIVLGFQHYISMFIGTLTVPLLLSPAICLGEDNVGKTWVIGTLFVCSGIITLLQNLIGVRLPVVQAGTFALLVPTLAYFDLPEWKCPANIGCPGPTANASCIEVGSPEHREIWMSRLQVVQGSLMMAALVEVIFGITGFIGVMMSHIGPLTICPTITLLGLSLFKSSAEYCSGQWGIGFLTIGLMVLFSQYMKSIKVPCFMYTTTEKCHSSKFPIFQMFPILFAILISWGVCFILTYTDALPSDPTKNGYQARTDLRLDVLRDAPWFRFPYPFQWGMPTFSIACVIALLSGILVTTIESVGDYMAYAKLSGAPIPPFHAINRGIAVEGLGSILDGMFGTGNGTTSTTINVGVIGITKVGSRSVIIASAFFMIILGVFTKFGALFVTVPDPIIGGCFIILFGMIVAVGLSNLQYVDLNSSRNLFIIGISIMLGLTIPEWLKENSSSIHTGSTTLDSVILVLLRTNMFVAGMLGFIFDNTMKGSLEERGLLPWKMMRKIQENSDVDQNPTVSRMHKIYDFPCGMSVINKVKCFKYVPICPTFSRNDHDVHIDEETPMAVVTE